MPNSRFNGTRKLFFLLPRGDSAESGSGMSNLATVWARPALWGEFGGDLLI